MNIVLAVHQFPPLANGGTEQLTRWTAVALREAGHSVRLIAGVPRTALPVSTRPESPYRVDGIEVTLIARPLGATPGVTGARLEYDDPAVGISFARSLERDPPDVVHFLHMAGLTTAALIQAVKADIPFVVTSTDFWFECPMIQLLLPDGSPCAGPQPDRGNCLRHHAEMRTPWLTRARSSPALDWSLGASAHLAGALLSRLPGAPALFADFRARSKVIGAALGHASAVIAPTRYMHERLAQFGVLREKIRLIPYGIPAMPVGGAPDANRSRTRGLRIAFAGALVPHKGVRVLLDALEHLPNVDLTVEFYGQAADPQTLRDLETRATLDQRISLCGMIPHARFRQLLMDIDLLVVPSIWMENAPLVALEAAALSCPMLVSDVPGFDEIVRPNVNGWVFRRNDAADLAAKLQAIAGEPEALVRMRNTRSEVMSIENHVDALHRVYEIALRSRVAA